MQEPQDTSMYDAAGENVTPLNTCQIALHSELRL